MATETRNPLPVGRYWVQVFDRPPGHMNEFTAWAVENSQKIDLETTEENAEADPPDLFVIFKVVAPVFFPSSNFGFPNIAPPEIKNGQDVLQKPDVKEPTVTDVAETFVTVGKWAAAAAGLLLLARLLKKG